MASVRKREWEHNGVKKTAWVVEYTDPSTGKRKRFTPKSGLKKDAEKERLRIENEVEAGTHTASSESPLVSVLLEDLIKYEERRLLDEQIGEGLFRQTKMRIVKKILPRFGRYKLSEITNDMIEDWYADLRNASYSPKTARSYVYTFVQAEALAFKRKRTKITLVADAHRGLGGASSPKIKTFKSEEVRQILKVAESRVSHCWRTDMFVRCFINIAAFCGLRWGEIAALTYENVDLEEGIIHVRHNVTCWGKLKGPKTDAGVRDVPMPPNVTKLIVEWKSKFYVANKWGLIFCAASGREVSRGNFWRVWARVLQNAGLEGGYHFHALRHFAASWMIKSGLPLTDVAQLLGHDKFDMTLQVYAHPIVDHKARSAAFASMANNLLALDATSTRQGLPTN